MNFGVAFSGKVTERGSKHNVSNFMMITDWMKIIWKEKAVADLKLLFQHLSEDSA
jgi:hypothetical protein